ncbi:hypothetical protein R1flu_021534 [Riccia fluitans]|uniref:Uncharacterized protein n=1 Tax=Riccia fluitans TaxID=41844 RepID=A0ABD1ZRM1_9MARC
MNSFCFVSICSTLTDEEELDFLDSSSFSLVIEWRHSGRPSRFAYFSILLAVCADRFRWTSNRGSDMRRVDSLSPLGYRLLQGVRILMPAAAGSRSVDSPPADSGCRLFCDTRASLFFLWSFSERRLRTGNSSYACWLSLRRFTSRRLRLSIILR